ncbi:hypothetical protein ACX9NE_22280 [Mycobacterium sp. ML4]
MTTVDENQTSASAGLRATEECGSAEADFDSGEFDFSLLSADEVALGKRWAVYAAEHPNSKRVAALRKLKELERREVELPFVGKVVTPVTHDVVYVAGLVGLLALGAVELPIALIVLGGHVLVKQHQNRSLSALGQVMEDVLGPPIVIGSPFSRKSPTI